MPYPLIQEAKSPVAFSLIEDLADFPAPMHPVMALVCNWEGKGQLACFTAMQSPEASPSDAISGFCCLLRALLNPAPLVSSLMSPHHSQEGAVTPLHTSI